MTEQVGTQMSRRQFLMQVGKAGGAVAVYSAMSTLGLLGQSASAATLPPPGEVNAAQRNGKRIVILGAGLAGMTAALEMTKAGYECVILEARSRPGGRNWTIRRGDAVTETGGVKQVARFDEGLYFNPGPARIPQHHITMKYCRELGVPLEVFGNVNDAAYFYSENVGPLSGKKIRKREAKADVRGYTSELLAKAVDRNALNLPLTESDKEKLVAYLRREGDLDADLFYKGSGRRGYKVLPGGGETPGVREDPYNLSAIIQSGFGNSFNSEYSLDQQMMMFQPVGGMDQIGKAFARKVGHMIRYQAVVQRIRQSESGVSVTYRADDGSMQEATGDYCICTIPLSVLKDIPADFSKEMSEAIGKISYATTGKIGFQFRRRFWEIDEGIYSGMTTTNMDINQIWYPSSDYLSRKGIVVGYYNFGEAAVQLGDMSLAEREEYALKQGAKIHPQYHKEFETSFSIAWHKTTYNMGGWASYSAADRKDYYPTLNKPDGRVYLAGEHMSYLTGWMAGAFESALLTVKAIQERVMKA